MNEDAHRRRTAAASTPETRGDAGRDPLDWPAGAGAADDVMSEIRIRLKRRRRRRIQAVAMVAALLAIAGLTGRIALRKGGGSELFPQSVVVSMPARQTLSDGSIVDLKNDAKIRVAFTESVRHVVMERGEAHFQVAKHQPRPFVVSAGGVEFRAVGTAFSVSLGEKKVEMMVTEGRVSVDRAQAPSAVIPAGTAQSFGVVAAGHRVIVDLAAEGPVPAVDAVSTLEVAQRLAWRAPKLEFSATPLSEAVEMINRYPGDRPKPRLVLGDANLASVRLTGILRADNVETLVELLATDYGIRAERHGDEEIVLRSAR